jgi:serine/threonine protein kinase
MVMARLRHENLVRLIGVSTESSPMCIIVEFMARGNLLDHLRRRGGGGGAMRTRACRRREPGPTRAARPTAA